MPDSGFTPKRVRTLGALVIGAVSLLLIGRFVIRKDDGALPPDIDPTPPSETGLVTSAPSASGAGAPPSLHVRYESALVPKKIFALSSGAGTALAVGESGTILQYRLDVPKWTPQVSAATATLRGVAQQVDDAIAVGDQGAILELEAERWSLIPPLTSRTLRAVVYSSYGAIAVGDGGTILRRDAPHSAWHLELSGTTRDLFGVCAGLRDVWIVGQAGTVIGRVNDAWIVQPSVTTSTLSAVACDDHGALAVGEKGALLERIGDAWRVTPAAGPADLLAVAAPIGTRSWLAVGASGAVVHVTGEATLEPESVDWALRAVTEGALGTWVAGDEGILRRTAR